MLYQRAVSAAVRRPLDPSRRLGNCCYSFLWRTTKSALDYFLVKLAVVERADVGIYLIL